MKVTSFHVQSKSLQSHLMFHSQGNLVHEYLFSSPPCFSSISLSSYSLSLCLSLLNTTSTVTRPKWVYFLVSLTETASKRIALQGHLYLCKYWSTGNNFECLSKPEEKGQAEGEYSEGDFNIRMRLRPFLIHLCLCLPQMFLVLFQQFASQFLKGKIDRQAEVSKGFLSSGGQFCVQRVSPEFRR